MDNIKERLCSVSLNIKKYLSIKFLQPCFYKKKQEDMKKNKKILR